MREADQYAKRLSDVVEASWDHIRRATHPISYLGTLLGAPVDFAFRVRSKRAEIVENTARDERAADAREAVKELVGNASSTMTGCAHTTSQPMRSNHPSSR